jgi:trans-aconitate methyltransferase
MVENMAAQGSGGEDQRRWDSVHAGGDATRLSWYQSIPATSLDLIATLRVPRDAAIIDVGGGASTLVDALCANGYSGMTVLDISAVALLTARRRAGEDAATWLVADLLTWSPDRRYDLWHDRATFHFLVDEADRARYRDVLHRALRDGGHAIVATFAPDAPEQCSGMPVHSYDADSLVAALGDGFDLVATRREVHHTPTGVAQPFTWIAARYAADRASSGT